MTEEIILLDDVITSGISINNTIKLIYSHTKNTKISGIIVALDRAKKNILTKIEKQHSLKIISIINTIDIIKYFKKKNI